MNPALPGSMPMDTPESLSRAAARHAGTWFASSLPLCALQADPALLHHLDPRDASRLQPGTLRRALQWTTEALTGFGTPADGPPALDPSCIRTDTRTGRELLEAIRGIPDLQEGDITLEAVRRLLADEGTRDARPVDELHQLLRQSRAMDRWEESMPPAEEGDPPPEEERRRNLCYLGLRKRIDEFFRLCRLCRLHPGFRTSLQESPVDPGQSETLPLAAVNTEEVLRLNGPVHPRDEEALRDFRERILVPFLGSAVRSLRRDQWMSLRESFAAVEAWGDRRPPGPAGEDREPVKRLEARLESARRRENLQRIEKAILFRAHLGTLCRGTILPPSLAELPLFGAGVLHFGLRELRPVLRLPPEADETPGGNRNLPLLVAEIAGSHRVVAPLLPGGAREIPEGSFGFLRDPRGREHTARVVRIERGPQAPGRDPLRALAAPAWAFALSVLLLVILDSTGNGKGLLLLLSLAGGVLGILHLLRIRNRRRRNRNLRLLFERAGWGIHRSVPITRTLSRLLRSRT